MKIRCSKYREDPKKDNFLTISQTNLRELFMDFAIKTLERMDSGWLHHVQVKSILD